MFLTVSKLLGIGIYAAFGLLLPRFLPVEVVGVFNLTNSLLIFGGTLANFGLPIVLIRNVSQRPDRASEQFVDALTSMLGGAVLAMIALFSWVVLAYSIDDGFRLALTGMACLVIVVDTFGSAGDGLHQAKERMGTPALVDIAATLLKVAIGLASIFFASEPQNALFGIYAGFLAGSLLRAVWLYRASRKRFLPGPLPAPSFARSLAMLKEAGAIAIFRAFRMIRSRVDLILLGTLLTPMAGFSNIELGDKAAAFYGQGVRIVSLLGAVAFALNSALFPRVASKVGEDGVASEGADLFYRAVRVMTLWVAPLVVLGWLYADQVAGVFGHEYVTGAPHLGLASTAAIFPILLVAFLLDAAGGPVGLVLVSSRKLVGWLPWLGLMLATVSVSLNILLIPRFGLLGAALSSLVAGFFELLFKVILSRRLLGGWRRGVFMTVPVLALALLMGGVMKLAGLTGPERGLLDGVLFGAIGLLAYSASAWWLGLIDPSIKAKLRSLGRRVVGLS